MALFKCKACGGDIVPNEDKYTGKCEYCGTVQTLPKDKDEKISQILNRANDFRLNCDFDRAIFEYEKVLEFDEREPEAHWGIFLSRYGVEYVKDTMTFAYKPTLHRISSISVYDDVDYQSTLKYASLVAGEQYKKDASLIEEVMKEFLLLSANQESYDIFLSYKELDDVTRQRTEDSYLAHDLYNELTSQGYKVFFAPKSLGVGLYEPKIYSAIISSKVMIVLGTKPQYLEGVWVKNEWSRFSELIEKGEDKVLIPVFKNMEASQLPNRIAKYQAYNMASMTFLPSLFDAIAKSVKKDSKIDFNKNASAEDAFIERGFLALEDREFGKADSFFENALNLNPHSSQAYFGKLMVEMRINKKEQILTSSQPLNMYKNFEKAVRFADQQLKTVLLQYEEKVQYTLDEQVYKKAMDYINRSNPSVRDYEYAAEIFNSIKRFKDSEDKASFCLEKKKKYKSLIKEYREALRNETNFSFLNEVHKSLSNLKIDWGKIEDEICSLDGKLKIVHSEIVSLNNESSSLGFWDRKQKKEISTKISALTRDEHSIMQWKESIEKKKKGYTSLMELDAVIKGIENQINSQKNKRSSQSIQEELTAYEEGKWIIKLGDCNVGDYVFFGAYEQDNNTSNGKEDIEWLILEVKDDKALVISKYALDCKMYNTSRIDVTWETCTLRQWLNNDFINTAFTDDEKARIPTVTVSADANPKYNTSPGNATRDKVFLLSFNEVNKYFSSASAKQCKPTEYAFVNDAWKSKNGNCWWWLRSPGRFQFFAPSVDDGGGIPECGINVDYGAHAVRPAMWITIE